MTSEIHLAVRHSRIPPPPLALDRPRRAPLREHAASALVRLARRLDDRAAWRAFAPR